MLSESERLRELLPRETLLDLAGKRSYERGEDYYHRRLVKSLIEDRGKVVAKVRGTRDYQVSLWLEGEQIGSSCTCPMGEAGAFCKHCVALGLELIEGSKPGEKGLKASKPALTMKEVRAYLERQDKSVLIDIIAAEALGNDLLQERLVLKAAKAGGSKAALAGFRRAIDAAVAVHDYVPYRETYAYVSRIEEKIAFLDELLKDGLAEEVIELAEYATEKVDKAIEFVDDSDGGMGDLLARMQALHFRACEQARPDPEALARRLFALELKSEYDAFSDASDIYAKILGKKGLAVYRELAQAEWKRVRPLAPGQDRFAIDGKRFRITQMMETLARQAGDIDALVAVMERDLSSAYNFLQIAEVYKKARRRDLALEWAERGLAAFPERTDGRLRAFLAEEYHRKGRHDEAMNLIWAEFTDYPSLAHYETLKSHAERTQQWTVWREKALTHLRQQAAEAKSRRNRQGWGFDSADHSLLVQIFLWEKDAESAWQEASAGGCSANLWMELAATREKGHPEDALRVYQSAIEPTIECKNNQAYEEAVQLLGKMHKLMTRLDRREDFREYLESLRQTHKPKRNFIKFLNGARWA